MRSYVKLLWPLVFLFLSIVWCERSVFRRKYVVLYTRLLIVLWHSRQGIWFLERSTIGSDRVVGQSSDTVASLVISCCFQQILPLAMCWGFIGQTTINATSGTVIMNDLCRPICDTERRVHTAGKFQSDSMRNCHRRHYDSIHQLHVTVNSRDNNYSPHS